MTIDEAITHCIEVAEENERDIGYYTIQGDKEWLDECEKDCIECANEHRQLAEWLRELELYRETLIGRPCEVCKFHETGSCNRWECVFEEVNADDRNRCENYRK